jgi:hypothetical protein
LKRTSNGDRSQNTGLTGKRWKLRDANIDPLYDLSSGGVGALSWPYANTREIILLKDVSARLLLTEWRSPWTFKLKSGSPAVHWSVVKTFFRWAFANRAFMVVLHLIST